MFFCFRQRLRQSQAPVSVAVNASVAYFDTTRVRLDILTLRPAPKRSQTTTWKQFIQSHMAVLAGIDFFTVEVLTWRGLVTYYVLFFIHLESRRVSLAGITRHPDQAWMQQMARNATGETRGFLEQRRYGLHDRDTKFRSGFGRRSRLVG
jgi:hypothetical protein